MFSGLLSARLKAAEKALHDGRLDEAYRLAGRPGPGFSASGLAKLFCGPTAAVRPCCPP